MNDNSNPKRTTKAPDQAEINQAKLAWQKPLLTLIGELRVIVQSNRPSGPPDPNGKPNNFGRP